MLTTYVNTKSVNEKKLEIFEQVAKHTMFKLIEQCDDNMLVSVRNPKALADLSKSLDRVLVNKLRVKLGL